MVDWLALGTAGLSSCRVSDEKNAEDYGLYPDGLTEEQIQQGDGTKAFEEYEKFKSVSGFENAVFLRADCRVWILYYQHRCDAAAHSPLYS